MDELDKKIKDILKKTKSAVSGEKEMNCPEEIVLSQFIDDVLDNSDKQKMEHHLVECSFCLDQVIMHKKIREEEALEGMPDVPHAIVQRAMNLVTAKKKDLAAEIVDVILTFAKETIEIMNPGNLSISYGAVPVPVRGEKKTVSSNMVTLHKVFAHLEAEVDVERIGDGTVNIRITTKDISSSEHAGRLRISLFNPHREIASDIVERGEAHFDMLRLGEYVIRIHKKGEEIGHVSLNIKE
jgi:hypothetical protein